MDVEKPTVPPAGEEPMAWASDAIAELLRRLELPYLSLNPGASYRGLHDSLVNYLGNERPQMLVCLHEEHAVALAHGYAKVDRAADGGRAALQRRPDARDHGPLQRLLRPRADARARRHRPGRRGRRRPWIDWIHTSADQGALIRSYVKWDDQPASVAAAHRVARARRPADRAAIPRAPVYVCLDAALQEAPLTSSRRVFPDLAAPPPRGPAGPARRESRRDRRRCSRRRAAADPGRARQPRRRRVGGPRARSPSGSAPRVLTDLKVAAAFPTAHPLHPAAPGTFLPAVGRRRAAAPRRRRPRLDWVDLGGHPAQACGESPPAASGSSPAPTTPPCTTAGARITSRSRRPTWRSPPIPTCWSARCWRGCAPRPPGDAAPGLAAARARTASPAPHDAAERRSRSATLPRRCARALAGRPACLVARSRSAGRGATWSRRGPARLPRPGRRRRASAPGPGMAVGRRPRARGSGAPRRRRARRRRLPDGRQRAVDRRPLPAAAAHRRRQQPHLPQRRGPPGARRAARARARSRTAGSASSIRDPDPDLAALARSLGLRRASAPWRPAATLADDARAGRRRGRRRARPSLVDVHVLGSDYAGAATESRDDLPPGAHAAATPRARQGERR